MKDDRKNAKYFVHLHGDHGFISGGSRSTLHDAIELARITLVANPYFRAAEISHGGECVAGLKRNGEVLGSREP